jgi:hypothetical protein
MPNLYVPRALDDLVKSGVDSLEAQRSKDESADEYVSEWEALVTMLRPEFQQEFEERHHG